MQFADLRYNSAAFPLRNFPPKDIYKKLKGIAFRHRRSIFYHEIFIGVYFYSYLVICGRADPPTAFRSKAHARSIA